MLAPEVEGRPWPEQVAIDDAGYRAQLAYLFDRSAFYRDKLTSAVSGRPNRRRPATSPAAADREDEIRRLHSRHPIGGIMFATPSEMGGSIRPMRHHRTPSYIPPRADSKLGDGLVRSDADQRHSGSARRFLLQRGRSWPRGDRAFDRMPLPIPLGTVTTSAMSSSRLRPKPRS